MLLNSDDHSLTVPRWLKYVVAVVTKATSNRFYCYINLMKCVEKTRMFIARVHISITTAVHTLQFGVHTVCVGINEADILTCYTNR